MTLRDPLPPALVTLTFVTGLVDAVSFLALDVFTANMTGNVVLLAFAVAGAPGLSVPRSLTSLLAFLIGAVVGGRLGLHIGAARRRWLLIVAGSEAALLFAAALTWSLDAAPAPSRLYGVIVLTAVAMGLRNATVRQLAVPDLTTTVLTLTLTALSADSALAGGSSPRLGRRVAAVVAMFAGAALGALLLRAGPQWPLALSGASVLAVTTAYAVVPTPTSPAPAS